MNSSMPFELGSIILESGAHNTRADGVCFLEAVSWWSGQDHSYHPQGVSRVLCKAGVGINDELSNEKRQRLKPFIPRLMGTDGDGKDGARCLLALDWMVRTFAPAWLDAARLPALATQLRHLPEISDFDDVETIRPVTKTVRQACFDAIDIEEDRELRNIIWSEVSRSASSICGLGSSYEEWWYIARWAKGTAIDAAYRSSQWGPRWSTIDRLHDSLIELYEKMIDPTGSAS